MDFDAADENEVDFNTLLRNAREEILRAASPFTLATDAGESDAVLTAAAWSSLEEKNEAFKDVVREARKRGALLGPVLVAADGLTRKISAASRSTPSEGNQGGPSPAAVSHVSTVGGVAPCTSAEAAVLVALARLYTDLFEGSPVPTRCAWEAQVSSTFGSGALSSALTEFRSEPLTPSTAYAAQIDEATHGGRHVTTGATQARASTATNSGDDVGADNQAADTDDGAFVEEAFKSFLRRCQVLGRKCCRSGTAGGEHVKEMNATIAHYLSSGTLEW